jgi:hypothetical protein
MGLYIKRDKPLVSAFQNTPANRQDILDMCGFCVKELPNGRLALIESQEGRAALKDATEEKRKDMVMLVQPGMWVIETASLTYATMEDKVFGRIYEESS